MTVTNIYPWFLFTISLSPDMKMLSDFVRALDVVFSLVGFISIVFAVDTLGLTKATYRMVKCIEERNW